MMLRGIVQRSSVLSRLRVPLAAASSSTPSAQIDSGRGRGLFDGVFRRCMSDAAQEGISEKEALDRVLVIVKAHPKVNPAKLNTNSHFMNDLELDSLDVVEIVMGFEEEFNLYISDEDADKLVSVPAAVDFVAKHPMAR